MAGPFPYPESPFPERLPPQALPPSNPSAFYPEAVPLPYPGTLPPPVNYPEGPRQGRTRVVALVLLAVLMVAAVASTIVFATQREGSASVTDETAKAAIQKYLDALSSGDDEAIARNASCGLFDELRDRRSDMALADLASDAFRKQYNDPRVTSIDKLVVGSPTQTQVLFTMQAVPAGGRQADMERQGVAQLLVQGSDILVCSYLLRVGQFN